jgi:hypothetical protein
MGFKPILASLHLPLFFDFGEHPNPNFDNFSKIEDHLHKTQVSVILQMLDYHTHFSNHL